MVGSGGVSSARDLLKNNNFQENSFDYDPQSSSYLTDSVDQTQSGFSFDVYGNNLSDPYTTTTSALATADDGYDYSSELAPITRPGRTRRKVLPSAPAIPPPVSASSHYVEDMFENEPLSYNSQPPTSSSMSMGSRFDKDR